MIIEQIPRKCPNCHGSGEIDKKKCHSCGGRGIVFSSRTYFGKNTHLEKTVKKNKNLQRVLKS